MHAVLVVTHCNASSFPLLITYTLAEARLIIVEQRIVCCSTSKSPAQTRRTKRPAAAHSTQFEDTEFQSSLKRTQYEGLEQHLIGHAARERQDEYAPVIISSLIVPASVAQKLDAVTLILLFSK